MALESDYTVLHIEDDVATWRENPNIIYSMIRDILDEPDSDGRAEGVDGPQNLYGDVAVTRISWKIGGVVKRANFVFTTHVGIDECKQHLQGELTFILDAMRPGAKDRLELKVFESLASIAPLVTDSDIQLRVFTAYTEVEDELRTPKKAKKTSDLKAIKFPVTVIPKSQGEQLQAFILGRLGFKEEVE